MSGIPLYFFMSSLHKAGLTTEKSLGVLSYLELSNGLTAPAVELEALERLVLGLSDEGLSPHAILTRCMDEISYANWRDWKLGAAISPGEKRALRADEVVQATQGMLKTLRDMHPDMDVTFTPKEVL